MQHPWSQSHNQYNAPCSFRPFAIPNENIRRCPRGQRTNPNDVAQAVNGNRNFVYAPGVFRIKQDITKDASDGRNGHAIHVGRKCYVTPAFLGVPKKGEQNQKSKPTPGVTMMHHATKRGFKDCPGFLNSTGRLGPKRGRKCYVTPAFSGVPNKGEQNHTSKPTLRVTMMPLGAPSISKYGSLVRLDAQIVALRAHCA